MNQTRKQELNPIVRGDLYRRTHKASVIGILGKDTPNVISRGSHFYNMDRWTARALLVAMGEWAGKNPGCVPTRNDVKDWVNTANRVAVPRREIVIANTPDRLPLRTALGITGGAYHEAFHTKYSCRRQLTVDEISPIVLPRWAKVKDWSRLVYALLEWTNVIEDTRIERAGRIEFEGTFTKLCDLQDFIISMERQGIADLRSHGGKPGALSVVVRTFRDVSLGYNTEIQRAALEQYRTDNGEAYALVTNGPLTKHVRETAALGEKDDLGCIRIAMDCVAELAKLSKEDESDQQAQQGQAGDGETKCPHCGADGNKIVVRPKSDGRGGKVKGVGIATCTVCGWQQEVKIEAKKEGSGKSSDQKNSPKFEGFDSSDFDESDDGSGQGKPSDGKGGKSGKGKSGNDKKNDPSGKKEQGDKRDQNGKTGGKDKKEGQEGGEDEAGEDEAGAGSEEGDKEKQEGTDGKEEGGSGKETGEKKDGNEEGDGGNDSSDDSQPIPPGGQPGGAGGHHQGPDQIDGNDWTDIAKDTFKEAQESTGPVTLDNNTALEDSVNAEMEKECKNTKRGEALWNPYDPGLDEAFFVRPSSRGKSYDTEQADHLLNSVKEESAYLRARLRTIIHSFEQVAVIHGVPKGRGLSSRFLVDTVASVRAHERPEKAYFKRGIKLDMTMAAAVVMDESGSMSCRLGVAAQIFCAIVEPLDCLNFPTLAIGFRNGQYPSVSPGMNAPEEERHYHRTAGVVYDVFKTWGEKFKPVRWRFANTRADGGTPMSDGIQFALAGLGEREEAHRVLFVVTDGDPDHGHEEIIRRQCRLAKEAGIHVIGVGIGSGAEDVKSLFPDHVWSPTVSHIPKMLISKLNELADLKSGKRGLRPKLDKGNSSNLETKVRR